MAAPASIKIARPYARTSLVMLLAERCPAKMFSAAFFVQRSRWAKWPEVFTG